MSSVPDSLSQISSSVGADKSPRSEANTNGTNNSSIAVKSNEGSVDLKLEGRAAAKTTKKYSYINRAMLHTSPPAAAAGAGADSLDWQVLSGYYHPSWHQERSYARCARIHNRAQFLQKFAPAAAASTTHSYLNNNKGLDLKLPDKIKNLNGSSKSMLYRSKTMPSVGNASPNAATSVGGGVLNMSKRLPSLPNSKSTSASPRSVTSNQQHQDNGLKDEVARSHEELESDYKGCHILLETGTWDTIRRKNHMALTEFVRIVDPKPLHVSPHEGANSKSFRESFKFLEKYYRTREKENDGKKINIPHGQQWRISVRKTQLGYPKAMYFEEGGGVLDLTTGHQQQHQFVVASAGVGGVSPRKDYNPALSPISEARKSSHYGVESLPESADKNVFYEGRKAENIKDGKPWWRKEVVRI